VTTPALRHGVLLPAAATLFSTGGAAIQWVTLSGWQIASGRLADGPGRSAARLSRGAATLATGGSCRSPFAPGRAIW